MTGIPEGEERMKQKNIWSNNGSKLSKINDNKPEIQEALSTLNKINTKEKPHQGMYSNYGKGKTK